MGALEIPQLQEPSGMNEKLLFASLLRHFEEECVYTASHCVIWLKQFDLDLGHGDGHFKIVDRTDVSK